MIGAIREKYVPVITVNELDEKDMERRLSNIELEECYTYQEAYESIKNWIEDNVDNNYNEFDEWTEGIYKDTFKYASIEKRFTYDYLD